MDEGEEVYGTKEYKKWSRYGRRDERIGKISREDVEERSHGRKNWKNGEDMKRRSVSMEEIWRGGVKK